MIDLFTLHGFLGFPGDWSFLEKGLNARQFVHFNLSEPNLFAPSAGLWEAGRIVNHLARKSPRRHRVIMGYSLGGRIALHALIEDPGLWCGAILISTHPGLETKVDKDQRIVDDLNWSNRFLKEAWDNLIEAWNSQSVFAGGRKIPDEVKCSRSALSNALIGWSLATQENLKEKIKTLQLPILWVTGAGDTKFTDIAKNIALSHPHSRKVIISDAAHRVPWEQPALFIEEINQFTPTCL